MSGVLLPLVVSVYSYAKKMFEQSLLYVLAFLLVTSSAEFDLTVLHTNDVHARIEETDK